MKKFISGLMILCMFQGCAVFAELGTVTQQNAVVDNTKYVKIPVIEADFTQGTFPADWNSSDKATIEDKGLGKGNSAVLTVSTSVLDREIYDDFSSSVMTGDKYLFTSEFYFSNNTYTRPLMSIRQFEDKNEGRPNAENYILRAGNNGYFQVSNNNFDDKFPIIDIMPYSGEMWYKIDMVIDLANDTYEYYVNDKVVMTKRSLPQEMIKINRITPAKQFDGKNGDAWVAIDNIGFYDLRRSVDDIHNKYIKTKLIEENFESYTPTPDASISPIVNFNYNGAFVRPTSDPAKGGTSAYFEANSTVNASNDAELYKNQTITAKKLLITAEYKFTSSNKERRLLTVQPPEICFIRAGANGKLKKSDGSTDISPNINYDTTKWYKVDVFLDIENKYAETFIDGSCVEKITVSNSLSTIDRVTFFKQFKDTSTHGVYVDNVGVYALSEKNDYIINQLKEEYSFETIKEENFNNFTDAPQVTGFIKNGDSSLFSIANNSADGYGNSLITSAKRPDTDTRLNSEFGFTLPSDGTGKIVVKASYKFGDNDISRKILFDMYEDAVGGTDKTTISAWNKSNFVSGTDENAVIIGYIPNQWYDILGVFDMKNNVYDMYINGEKFKTGESLSPLTKNKLGRMFFIKHWDIPVGKESSTQIDNIGIYKLTPDITPKVKVTKYGDEVTEMSQLSGGDVIKATIDRDVDDTDVLFFVQKKTDDITDILVAGKNEGMECVIKLPLSLTDVSFNGFLWSGFEALMPRIDKMELK